jgi:MerR family copper efflux transcriptional regulator
MPHKTDGMKLSDFLTVGEAAGVLGVSASTLRHWDRTSKLKSTRHPINGYRLYRREDLRDLLDHLVSSPKVITETGNPLESSAG